MVERKMWTKKKKKKKEGTERYFERKFQRKRIRKKREMKWNKNEWMIPLVRKWVELN